MKEKWFFQLICSSVVAIIIVCMFFFGIVLFPKDIFYSSFQSVIVDKVNKLENEESPKIIIVGGSGAGFGINEALLEEKTGYPVCNLGLHLGFGFKTIFNFTKGNIHEGDIVLLALEHTWYKDQAFESFGTDLIMSGIDSNIGMYKYIPLEDYPHLLGYLWTYAQKKNSFVEAEGVYSRSSFDNNLRMLSDRKECIIDYDNLTKVDFTNEKLSDNSIKFLRDYKSYCESNGARVFFVGCPFLKDCLDCDIKEYQRIYQQEEIYVGIENISILSDYLFEKEYMYDSINHCNSKGADLRTQLLVADLERAGVID